MKPISKVGALGTEQEDVELMTCVINCIKEAEQRKLKSIALPAISSGIFGYPKDRCAQMLFQTVKQYFLEDDSIEFLKEVRFTNFDDKTVDTFVEEFDKQFKQ